MSPRSPLGPDPSSSLPSQFRNLAPWLSSRVSLSQPVHEGGPQFYADATASRQWHIGNVFRSPRHRAGLQSTTQGNPSEPKILRVETKTTDDNCCVLFVTGVRASSCCTVAPRAQGQMQLKGRGSRFKRS